MKAAISLTALAAALALPHAVRAQEADSEVASDTDAAASARIYTYADLAQYAPQTALDMVSRIPGFSISGGQQGRGLGQASQNVLINGARVSGKSNDAFDALQRIDARKVVRIEILDGATLDVPGLSGEVANVVYEAGGISGTWRYNAQRRERIEDTLLDAAASLSGGGASDSWSVSVETGQSRRGNFGPEQRFDADGNLLFTRDEFATYNSDRPSVSGNYSKTFPNGHVLNLNGSGGLGIQRNRVEGTLLRTDGSGFDELFEGGEDEWEVELGADYALGLGDGRLKLIGLQRNEHSPTFDTFGVVGGASQTFDRTIDESESILRGEYGWKSGSTDWELSAEGAYNVLASQSELLDSSDNRTAFPDQDIAEKRGEAILSMSRPLTDAISLQLNGGAEYSEIVADQNDAVGYFNPKGSAAVSWRASDNLTIDARLERRIDQLNFFDFLSAVDLRNDNDRSRNNAISPPKRWVARLEAVAKLGAWGSFTPNAEYQRISGVIESIPVSATEEALGNAGDATRWRVGAEGTLLLAPIGIQGARLDFSGFLSDSEILDPLLGSPRPLNSQTYALVSLNFRHDIPGSDLAYGANFFTQDEDGRFRLNQFANRYNSGPQMGLFVEHKDVIGVQVRAGVENLLNSRDLTERVVYVDRRDGPVAFREFSDRSYGRILYLSLSGKI